MFASLYSVVKYIGLLVTDIFLHSGLKKNEKTGIMLKNKVLQAEGLSLNSSNTSSVTEVSQPLVRGR